AAGSRNQGARFQSAGPRSVPRQASHGRLLHRVEGQIRRRSLGLVGKIGWQVRVGAARRSQPWQRPNSRWFKARSGAVAIESFLGSLIEIGAANLVVAEIGILFGGVISRYVFDRPLVWSDELASTLFLWLAMLGAVIAFRRDEHMRMTACVGMF